MNKKLNINGKLDFSEIDLTAPDIVIKEILDQLPEETNMLVMGRIVAYQGQVMSYTQKGFSGLAAALGNADEKIDIQDRLGKIGVETHKFECYLYTPNYEKFKYRVFFVKYDISNYPATVVLEDSVAQSISGTNAGYVYTCNTRAELDDLVMRILTSKRIIAVMQELVRVSQAKKTEMNLLTARENEKSE